VQVGTAISLALNVDPDALTMLRQTDEELPPLTEALQQVKAQARRARKSWHVIACDHLIVAWTFLYAQNSPITQVQDIHTIHSLVLMTACQPNTTYPQG
jgi:hypothetical protein